MGECPAVTSVLPGEHLVIEICSGWEPLFTVADQPATPAQIARAEAQVVLAHMHETGTYSPATDLTDALVEKYRQDAWFHEAVQAVAGAIATAARPQIDNRLVFAQPSVSRELYQVPGRGVLEFSVDDQFTAEHGSLRDIFAQVQVDNPIHIGPKAQWGSDFWLYRGALIRDDEELTDSEIKERFDHSDISAGTTSDEDAKRHREHLMNQLRARLSSDAG
jgi:hypothetical protein